MALTPSQTERLLSITDRAELLQSVHALPAPLSLSDLRQVAEHAAVLKPGLQAWRVGFVRSYTSELLTPWLEVAGQLQGLQVEPYHAPYGVLLGEASADSGLVAHRPDITVLMLQRHDLHPALLGPIAAAEPAEAERILDEALSQIRELVHAFRALPVGQLVVSLLPPPAGPALGLHDAQAERSERRFWDSFMSQIGRWLRQEVPSSLLLDLDGLMAEVGKRRAMDARHWLTARYPFSAEGSLELAMRLASIGRLVKSPRAKVLVLDADNTLWGGVIGEDGMDGIALGPDYPGNAYVAFQRRILDLQQRGFVLAMCSKNNEADVAEVLERHPHQVLKAHHFVARRVNWEPKPANLASLAEELNLGLDSFVFVDDSDHECAAVRAQWPQVEVVQVPKRPQDVPACLDRVARLEVLAITAEDRAKTALYQAERQRQEILGQATAGADGSHLHRLGMQMQLRLDARRNIPRLAQLTQKTNQFNLTTRRYDESQVAAFVEAPDWLVLDFSLADVYGDSGIVGLALARLLQDGEAELDTFLMSCRVIGRCAEDAFMLGLLQQLQARGVRRLSARYIPTPKNVLVKDLLPRLGFTPAADPAGRVFLRDLDSTPPALPAHFPIRMEWAAERAA
jgi:FkbH-like protein